jgi:hypothetical protein
MNHDLKARFFGLVVSLAAFAVFVTPTWGKIW